MNTLYLVRHGAYHRQGLTEEGKEDVQQTAQAIRNDLNGTSLITIYHGPLLRAQETALIIQRTLFPIGATLHQHADLHAPEKKVHEIVSAIELPAIIVAHEPGIEDYLQRIGHEIRTLEPGSFVKLTP